MNRTAIYCFLCLLTMVMSQLSDDPDQLLNWCLDGKHHKSKPGPEDELYQQCIPWKKRSCCNHNTTRNAHHSNLYNFNYNHCSHKRNMSDECRKHFIQDLCFYECSPNIGPWTVKVSMKTRNERFYQVPLCESDCIIWFDACRDDYTCTDDWVNGWVWSRQGNQCHNIHKCRTFNEVFGTAENFCEKVWDHSWKYTPSDQPCMRIWFDGEDGNPNDNVARLKILQMFSGSNSRSVQVDALIFGLIMSAVTRVIIVS